MKVGSGQTEVGSYQNPARGGRNTGVRGQPRPNSLDQAIATLRRTLTLPGDSFATNR